MNAILARRTLPVAILAASFVFAANSPLVPELGPGDVITIHALHVPEIGKEPVRIPESGSIELPMIGLVEALGRTPTQLAAEIRARLDAFVRQPEVSVDLVEVKSRPVSVMGAVKAPGVYQLNAQKRVLEIMAGAGGADETAGSVITISRMRTEGPLPLSGATESGSYSIGQINLAELVEGRHPETNILVKAHDVITVPRAKLVYVIGEVRKSGGFVLKDRESMSVLQAISLAEGLTSVAGSSRARILRPAGDGVAKTEIAVDVRRILSGKSQDVPLLPNDILFVPNSAAKNATLRGIESAIQMGTGIVIWRH